MYSTRNYNNVGHLHDSVHLPYQKLFESASATCIPYQKLPNSWSATWLCAYKCPTKNYPRVGQLKDGLLLEDMSATGLYRHMHPTKNDTRVDQLCHYAHLLSRNYQKVGQIQDHVSYQQLPGTGLSRGLCTCARPVTVAVEDGLGTGFGTYISTVNHRMVGQAGLVSYNKLS